MVIRHAHVRILARDLAQDFVPQHHRVLQGIGLGGTRQPLARSLTRLLEGVAQDTLDPFAREDRLLNGKFVHGGPLEPAADATILTFRILPDKQHADVLCAFALERRFNSGQNFHGAQVHIEIKPESDS